MCCSRTSSRGPFLRSGERGRLRGPKHYLDGVRRDRTLGRLGPAAPFPAEFAAEAAEEITYRYCTRWRGKVRSRRSGSGREQGDASSGRDQRRQGPDLGRLAVREVPRHHRTPGSARRRFHERGGLPRELGFEQRLHPLFEAVALLFQARHRIQEIPFTRSERERQVAKEAPPLPLAPEGPPAADEGHARAALVFFRRENRDHADLTAPGDVGPPARRPVEPANLDDTDQALHRGELPEREASGLRARNLVDQDLEVLPDRLVGALLDLTQELRVGTGMRDVDRDLLLTQMEGSRFRGRDLDECLGEDVLAGVLLHVVEAARPVERPLHARARSEETLGPVPDTALLLAHIGHARGAEASVVRGLPSPAGIEGGLVELGPGGAVPLEGMEYRAFEFADRGIRVVEKPGQERSLGCWRLERIEEIVPVTVWDPQRRRSGEATARRPTAPSRRY